LSVVLAIVGAIGYLSFANSVAQDSAKIASGDSSAAQHLGETTGNYIADEVTSAAYTAIIIAILAAIGVPAVILKALGGSGR
jgi:hypothetical protein